MIHIRPATPDDAPALLAIYAPLSRASIDFHTRLGYAVAGTFHRCGYKFGTWYDVVWMEKRLSDDTVPPAVVPYSAQVL